jgi:hypothetical protein
MFNLMTGLLQVQSGFAHPSMGVCRYPDSIALKCTFWLIIKIAGVQRLSNFVKTKAD